MLAKFFKNESVTTFVPFLIPDLGDSKNSASGVAAFAFPGVIDFATNANAGEIALASEPSESNVNLLENAGREAAGIIARAEAQSEMIEQAALEKGLQQAESKIAHEVAVRVAEMRLQLSETIAEVANLRSEISAAAENDVVRLALEIARKIVGREVTIDREIAVTLARIALARLNNRAVAAVHLNPEDFVYVAAHREKLQFHGALELVEDRSIEIGGCLVRTEAGDLDARIEAQFEEISNGLLG